MQLQSAYRGSNAWFISRKYSCNAVAAPRQVTPLATALTSQVHFLTTGQPSSETPNKVVQSQQSATPLPLLPSPPPLKMSSIGKRDIESKVKDLLPLFPDMQPHQVHSLPRDFLAALLTDTDAVIHRFIQLRVCFPTVPNLWSMIVTAPWLLFAPSPQFIAQRMDQLAKEKPATKDIGMYIRNDPTRLFPDWPNAKTAILLKHIEQSALSPDLKSFTWGDRRAKKAICTDPLLPKQLQLFSPPPVLLTPCPREEELDLTSLFITKIATAIAPLNTYYRRPTIEAISCAVAKSTHAEVVVERPIHLERLAAIVYEASLYVIPYRDVQEMAFEYEEGHCRGEREMQDHRAESVWLWAVHEACGVSEAAIRRESQFLHQQKFFDSQC